MHTSIRPFLLLSLMTLIIIPAPAVPGSNGRASTSHVLPKTRAVEVKESIQGTEIVDPYRWLEDQDSAQTRSWIAEQNAYTDSFLSGIPERDKLKQQLSALIKVDFTSTPSVRNGRYFFYRRLAGQDQFVYYMRDGLEGKDELLIDPEPLSTDHSVSVVSEAISQDGSLLVYALRKGGEDEVAPRLFDVDKRQTLPDTFPKGRYSSIVLLRDKTGMYFSRWSPEGPRVFFHKIGDDSSRDIEVFGKGHTSDQSIECRISEDGRYLALFVDYGTSSDKSDVYVQDLGSKGPIVPIVNDLPAAFEAALSGEAIVDGKLYLRTNWKAPRWRIVEVDLKNPGREHWREVIPENDAVLEGFTLVGGKISVRLTHNVVSRLKVFDLSGKMVREIAPPSIGNVYGLYGSWQGNDGFYSFSSFHVPFTIYRYDLTTGQQSVWSQQKISLEAAKYEVEQVWYPSKDGTRIPMFLAHAKGLKKDGSNPTLLTGYGGFDVNLTPDFSAEATAWMENGGVYAVANLRGGGEFGEAWHHAGMLEKKQTVFDDFIAAAEWLVKNKYTNSSRLAITGTSNGGLLMGAALTQRPDLFAAVICRYPLLDMVRYQKFLVAKYWVSEYGSSDDPQQFKYIYAYSPYHHVKAGTKYPAVLLITGDSDTRVAPLHARKMTALLQSSTGSDKPVILRYETKAGHTNALPASVQVDNLSEELSFLMWQLKMVN